MEGWHGDTGLRAMEKELREKVVEVRCVSDSVLSLFLYANGIDMMSEKLQLIKSS